MNRTVKQKLCVALAALTCVFSACGQQAQESAPPASQEDMTADNLSGDSAPAESAREEGIGEVYFLPFESEALMGTNTLSIYARKSGLQPGGGVLSLHREDGGNVAEIRFDDGQRVEFDTLTQGDRAFVGWDEPGTKATVILDSPLTEPGNYYVTMTENCLTDPVNGLGSKALEKGVWTFRVADYGIAGGSLFDKDTFAVGETVTVSVRLGDGAAKAAFSGYDPEMVEPAVQEVTADGELSLKCIKAGTTQWDVILYDEAGEKVLWTSVLVQVE